VQLTHGELVQFDEETMNYYFLSLRSGFKISANTLLSLPHAMALRSKGLMN
jgi:hypothetical protein